MSVGLSRLQAAFHEYVVQGEPGIVRHVRPPPRGHAERRLFVYANAYRARLAEALAEDFPALRAVLGEQEFDALCSAYLQAHPSRYRSLRWFGAHVPAFLREAEPYRNRPHLAELATMEWGLVDAFDAPDTEPLNEESLAQVPAAQWPAVRFGLHPSVQRVTTHWNVQALWRAAYDEHQPPAPCRLDTPGSLLVWRQGLSTRLRALDADEAAALDSAHAGETFARLCEQLTGFMAADAVALRAASLIKRWLADGLVVALES